MNDKCARLTEALVTAGLGSFARQSPLALTDTTSSTSPKSETDNSDEIEEIENPSNNLMVLDDKKDFSGIWETSEQRMNTRAPVRYFFQ